MFFLSHHSDRTAHSRLANCSGLLVAILLVLLLNPRWVASQEKLSAEKVRVAIKRAQNFLLSRQQADGSWLQFKDSGDVTCLVTLALLNAGMSPNEPRIKKAIRVILEIPERKLRTYTVALRVMALAAADPQGQIYKRDIAKDVRWLLSRQNDDPVGGHLGGWGYGHSMSGGDASNSQFAILALHEATQVGIEIPKENWERAKVYWSKVFVKRTGGFGYAPSTGQARGSMTCAGISSWIIIHENLADADNLLNAAGDCCQPKDDDDQVERALDWLARNFSVKGNPQGKGVGKLDSRLYYLYGMERAGRLSGQRFFTRADNGERYDWYRAGAEVLLQDQEDDGFWKGVGRYGESNKDIATSFGLLFLSKGKRPIVIGKLQHGTGDNWDLHPKGVHLLTQELESQWAKVNRNPQGNKLTWQTVQSDYATVEDLLEAPVLFLTGREAALLGKQAKKNLREYIENGGFLFAEACQGDGCPNQVGFDRAFRQLMKELFPDSQLELLPTDHPIWNAHHQIEPQQSERPLFGLQACCRTSVVYCPRNLSCYWQMNRDSVVNQLSRARAKNVEYCTQAGVNVVTYATGRQLRDKGDTPAIAGKAVSVLEERVLVLPKLDHQGGADEAPNAWRNVLNRVRPIGLRIQSEKKLIQAETDQLADHPFVFMHGREAFQFTSDQREALKIYLQSGHGFLFADSICSSQKFTESFRKEIKNILGRELETIPSNDPIWKDAKYGYQIDRVLLRTPDGRGGFSERNTPPQLEGISIEGRWVVVFSKYDLSCAMENKAVSQCRGYTRVDAERIGTNVLLYRLNSD